MFFFSGRAFFGVAAICPVLVMMFFSGRAFAVAVAEEQIFFLVAQVLRATPERQHVLFWSRFFSYTFVSAVRGFFSGRAFSMAAPERRNDFFWSRTHDGQL